MQKIVIAVLAATCALAGTSVRAATVFVKNASFEDQRLTDGGYINGYGPHEWSGGYASPTGPLNPFNTTFKAIPDGENVLYSATGVLGGTYQGTNYQEVAQGLAANTRYTLLVDIGHALDADMADFAVEFTDGFDDNATVFASKTLARDSITAGSFSTLALTFDSLQATARPLGIRFRTFYNSTQGNAQRITYFDNVRLDASSISSGAVPEPKSWALMIAGFGLVGSSLRRTRAVVRTA